MSGDSVPHEIEFQISKDSDIDMEDPDAPKIYTSDDERDLSSNRKRPSSVLSQPVSDGAPTSVDTPEEPKLPRKSQLAAPPSLVSYTIDEDDDEEEPSAHSDEEASGSDDSTAVKPQKTKPSADSVLDTSSSPVATSDFPFINLEEPPTILSSEHQINKEPIHVPSQEHLLNPPVPSETQPGPDKPSPQSDSPGPQGKQTSALDEVQLPPEPTGHCRMELQEKVEREVRRMRLDISYDPNRAIQDNKAFRNPSIYEKLISFLNIDEKGTNFPQEIYDPYRWTPQSHYDELARVQNREIDRLLKLQKEQKRMESNQSNTASATSNSQEAASKSAAASVATGFVEPKKRSKWDAGVPEVNHASSTTGSEPAKITTTSLPVGGLVKQK